MGRKRGGLAGLWDRNKQIIKPLATGLAGAFTGGLGGAAVGALMGGLDRPGKSGIGFDVKQGAIGGATGYGMGKLGEMGRGALASRFGATAAETAAPALPGMKFGPMGVPIADPAFSNVANAGISQAPSIMGGAMETGGGSALSKLSGLGASVKANPNAYAMGLQGLGQLSTSGAQNRQADADTRLSEARIAEMEYETEQKKKRDASMEQLRQMLGQNMPTFGNSAPTSPWNR